MTVLYVSDSTTVSGAEIVLLGYLDGLKDRGLRAHGYISHRNPRLAAALRERGIPFTATTAYSERIIQSTANPVALWEFARAFSRVTTEMSSVIREAGVDLIHSISYPACLYAAFAAHRTGTQQIWHEHNIKRLHSANRLIYRRVAETCRWVVGPSDAVTNNLGRAGIDARKLRTVYNGIDLSRFRKAQPGQTESVRRELGLSDGEQAVGLFGQMLPYKGHRTLIEAARDILRAHPRTRFYFVGALENPPYQQELKRLIDGAGLAERFCFTGWQADVPGIVRAMDVVVVATTTPEPAALMLMEAAAVERPVIGSRTGGTAEIVVDGQTGLLFEPGHAGQLAQQVIRLLAAPEFGNALGRAGRLRVERDFSLEHHLDAMGKLYELGDSPAPAKAAPVLLQGS